MLSQRSVPLSLARKISLLFGVAVLLTIIVTLAFPWLQMSFLQQQAMLVQAKRIASAAYQAVDLRRPDWGAAQKELSDRWIRLSEELGMSAPPPTFVPVNGIGSGFQQEAVERLRREREQLYFWRIQRDGSVFRFAMAVRAGILDPYPDELRGIIDVRLLIPKERGLWNAVVTILAGASGAVLAILVFYVITARLVLTPVRSLQTVAEQVTRGDIEVTSSIESGDEFQQLSEAFNNMLAHLRAAQEEQRKINRSLDIKLGELAETNVALYESNRMKSEFLANVSHELRTPLVSIIGFAELLRDAWEGPSPDPVRLARYSNNILTSGKSLLELINDLLDLAKIEAGKMELHLSEFSVVELCRDLADFVRPLIEKKNQQITLTFPDDGPTMHGDSGKVKQILYNLLSNAIKFTPAEGAIALTVECRDAERIRLTVSDTGPGIPPEQRQIVFEKFRQLDASATREHEGSGLGLAITRDLVHMLGGSIRLDGEVGEGATFIVELPIRAKPTLSRMRVELS